MNLKEKLFELTSATGVAGDEFSASSVACKMLKESAPDAHIDDFGNVIGNIGERSEDKPHILLDAHIDEIGMIVTFITDEGFLKVANCGGLDRRLFLAQQVTVHGKKAIKGVITSTPPHLEEAVSTARDIAEKGDIVTLSPACASFDMYPNFEVRGQHFKRLVNELN